MSAILERFGLFLRAPDARSRAEIEGDIDDELAFHVDQCALELQADGLTRELARAEAAHRFGDLASVRRACTRVQMGERIMVARIQLALTVLLFVAVVFLGWSTLRAQEEIRAQGLVNQALLARLEMAPAPAAVVQAPTVLYSETHTVLPTDSDVGATNDDIDRAWCNKFLENMGSWRQGLALATELAKLPDGQGVDILQRIWPVLPTAHREQAMKPFVFDGGHPRALEVLHLGALDNVDSVRMRAFFYLRRYALKDLLVGERTYGEWHLQNERRSVAEVLRASLLEAADRMQHGDHEAYEQSFAWVADLDEGTFRGAGLDVGRALIEAGIPAVFAQWDMPPQVGTARRNYDILQSWIASTKR